MAQGPAKKNVYPVHHDELSGLGDDDHTQYALADGSRDITGDQQFTSGLTIFDGFLTLRRPSTQTISGGAITITASFHSLDTEGAASTDDLVTINGGAEGVLLLLRPISDTRSIVLKHGTGNLRLQGASDFTMNNVRDTIFLVFTGSAWTEISRNDGG